ncbi:MAG: hypothetical protein NZ866_02540 [Patescibacteria group bacterium]|nr:hypothetical protein [Patescibacteria group bacterium]
MQLFKGQVLIITIFSLIITLGLIYLSLNPIANLLKEVKETTYYYQATEIANTGLEIEYFTIRTAGFDLLINTTSRRGGECEIYGENSRNSVCGIEIASNILNRTVKYCQYKNQNGENQWSDGYLNIKTATTNINININLGDYTLELTKIVITSQGNYKGKLANLSLYDASRCW